MTLWVAIALMLGATVWAVLVPLSRSPRKGEGTDVRVYKAQLEEVERDEKNGVILPEEAEAARLEMSRRLLSAKDQGVQEEPASGSHSRQRKTFIVGVFLLIPLISLGLYGTFGHPQLPDQPLTARLNKPAEKLSPQELVQRVERAVEREPDDSRAWEVLAPVYMRMSSFDKAATAFKNIIRLSGATAEREAALGEALTMQDKGIVSPEALAAFERALALQPEFPLARYYQGLSQQQKGNAQEASRIWQAMLRAAPEKAPWVALVRQKLVENALQGTEKQSPFSEEEGQKILAASPEEREQFIRSMVMRLGEQAEQNPEDINLRLRSIRALMLIGDTKNAQEAFSKGTRIFADRVDALNRLTDLAAGLGMDVELPE